MLKDLFFTYFPDLKRTYFWPIGHLLSSNISETKLPNIPFSALLKQQEYMCYVLFSPPLRLSTHPAGVSDRIELIETD